MCGIVGIMPNDSVGIGRDLFDMMQSLQHRGTDSAGVAIYDEVTGQEGEYILVAEVSDTPGSLGELSNAIGKAGGDIRDISFRVSPHGEKGINTCIIRVSDESELHEVVESVNKTEKASVYSYGKYVRVIKDLGAVEVLDEGYNLCDIRGTHGVGHVRFSTESSVDRHHAHPFHTDVFPDIALVHNGQITNYSSVRSELERKGFVFSSSNDSEVIVYFLVDKIRENCSLKDALKASVERLDGPFSYLVSTPEAIGISRDKLGLRPMALAEDQWGRYVASEEVALNKICESGEINYLKPGEVTVFERGRN